MENNLPVNNKYKIAFASLLALQGAIFIYFYLGLSYYNRLGRDDVSLIYMLNKYAFIGFIKYIYLSLEGCYSGIVLHAFVFSLIKDWSELIVFHIMALLLIVASCYLLFRAIFHLPATWFNNVLLILFSVYFSGAFFFLSLSKSETWFWPTGMDGYLISAMFVVLLFTFLYKQKMWPAAVLAFIVAGFTINYAAIALFLIFCWLAYEYYLNRKLNITLLVPFVALAIGCVLYVASPGNYVRMGHESVGISPQTLKTAVVFDIHFLLIKFFNVKRLCFVLIFTLPFAFLGYLKNNEKIKLSSVGTSALLIFAAVFAAGAINCFVYYGATGRGAIYPRIFELVSLMLVLAGAVISFKLGEYLNGQNKISFALVSIVSAALIAITISFYVKSLGEIKIAKAYASANDERLVQLLEQKQINNTDTARLVYFKPLPRAGLTNFCEIDTNPADGINQQYRLRYGLNFKIAKAKP